MSLKPRYPIQFYLNEQEYAKYLKLGEHDWTQKELFLIGVDHMLNTIQKAKDLVKEKDEKN